MKFREPARSHKLVYRKGELRPVRGLGPPSLGPCNRKQAQGMALLYSSTPPPFPGKAGFSFPFVLAGGIDIVDISRTFIPVPYCAACKGFGQH